MATGLDSTPHAAAVKIKTTHQTIKIKIKLRRKYCRLLCLTFHVKNPKLSLSLSYSHVLYKQLLGQLFLHSWSFLFLLKTHQIGIEIILGSKPKK
jgi:hypothetical protein